MYWIVCVLKETIEGQTATQKKAKSKQAASAPHFSQACSDTNDREISVLQL